MIKIPYNIILRYTECVKEFGEWIPYTDDIYYEFSVDDAEIEYTDLKDIVDEYFDDIIDILLSEYKEELMKKLKRIGVFK